MMDNILKNNFNTRLSIVIILSFVIGFGSATASYFLISNEQFSIILTNYDGLTPEEKCKIFNKCIQESKDPRSPQVLTSVGKEKIKKLQKLVETPIIQNALKNSNKKDSMMSEKIRLQIYTLREKEWTKSIEETAFMKSIIYNDVSEFLRENHTIISSEFGTLLYGEHILTNIYGANVAVSIKTDNYDQSKDDWWQQSFNDKQGTPFARECEFDKSADMNSEDLVIKITDENGAFIGILNSATPCDVILNKNIPFIGK